MTQTTAPLPQPPTETPTASLPAEALLAPSDTFVRRHVGPNADEIKAMLKVIGFDSLDDLIDATVPGGIRSQKPLKIGEPRGEHELLVELKTIAQKNKIFRSLIGQGYAATITPPVIQRNIFENPGWYTQYTPYQAEISQGRLEALLNFQTMVSDLCALPLANASLLDEGTAAAEAMGMCAGIGEGLVEGGRRTFFVDDRCHPQTIAVVQTRARSMGIDCRVVPISSEHVDLGDTCAGVLVQYPTTDGAVLDYAGLADRVHGAGGLLVVATDLLALTLIKPPGEFGADIAVGNSQRFGVPLGFGGPHAAFMATKTEFARKMPGRLVGVSKDAQGNPALRLTLQTREQHIRREKATSNICTAQVLLAIMAGMYAVYHGPHGLRRIAQRVHGYTCVLAGVLKEMGHDLGSDPFFDTLHVRLGNPAVTSDGVAAYLKSKNINARHFSDGSIGISLDELTTNAEIQEVTTAFQASDPVVAGNRQAALEAIPANFARTSSYLSHPVFNQHHSEHEILRYIKTLESRDLSLCHSMIPLGSCTMKLNGTTEMLPVTWPEFGAMHPFAPASQTKGYQQLFKTLEKWLADITGFAATSLQPNAGSQGEYAGLLAIRGYHESRGDLGEGTTRDICLIPTSAHGTNPASAVIAGWKVVAVACDAMGNIDLDDLKAKAQQHKARLAALMITYPSTHGVFEEGVKTACKIIHDAGGQVYMDGANMNAQVGLTSPGAIGADVCHLNLHKTFCIPHGGGGPGVGPICVARHLAKFLPGTTIQEAGQETDASERTLKPASPESAGPASPGTKSLSLMSAAPKPLRPTVSAAPYGSASILPISYVYIALMGGAGLKRATEVAILNANYMAKRLEGHYPILYRGQHGTSAHEFIVDCRAFEKSAGVKVEDIAKRLIDYGFHAPTMSWPVAGTLMIEPTESEDQAELDRFVDAMIGIRHEIAAIEAGSLDRADNPLKHAPHTAAVVTGDEWPHRYSRQQAAYPAPWTRAHKFWPAVGRVDNPFGDRNLVCTCPGVTEMAE